MPLFGLRGAARRGGRRGTRKLSERLGAPEPAVRAAAAEALGATDDPAALTALLTVVDDQDPGVRRAALTALAIVHTAIAIGGGGGVAGQETGPGAADAAGDPTAGTVERALLSAVDDPDPTVRRAAVTAAGSLGAGAVAALGRVLCEDPSPAVRLAAADAIDAAGWKDSVDTAGDSAGADPHAAAVAAAYRVTRRDWAGAAALGATALPALAAAAADHDAAVRLSAVGTMVDIGAPALGHLRAALTDNSRRVRTVAAGAMAETGDASVVTALGGLIADEDPGVRRTVVRAVAAIAGRGGVADAEEVGSAVAPELCAVLADPDPAVRAAAAEALTAIGAPAGGALSVALADVDAGVRLAAVGILGAVGDPAAAGPLCVTLADTDPEVSRAAADALTAMGEAAERALRVALRDESEHVRAVAGAILTGRTGTGDSQVR